MRLLEASTPTLTLYVLQRYVNGHWRLIYADPALLEKGGVFSDRNWGDSAYWRPFSTLGDCYKSTGIPGTFNRELALDAFKRIKASFEEKLDHPIIRVAEVRVRINVLEIEGCYPTTQNGAPSREVPSVLKKRASPLKSWTPKSKRFI